MISKKKKIVGALALSAGALALITVFAAASFDPDVQPIGYVGQPAVSSFIVSSGTEKLYAVDYKSIDWSGNLHSYNLTDMGAIASVAGVETDTWAGGASAKITAQNFDTGRKIVTFSGSAGVPFRWTSGISTAQKTALDATAATANATSSNILNYIRGDFSKQANNGQTPPGPYRTRTSALGDIIHSTPVHWNDGTNKTVFVGANDGMLHAINAADGTERFAYIPSMLMSKLGQLSNPAYTHKYYVDGRLDVRKFGAKTILAGALGAGGRGLFALDVTNANATSEADAASKILWEISNTGLNGATSTTYANLGYTYGAPTLINLPDADRTGALIVGNGYNNTGNGHASLYLINADTGALIKEIDTGEGTVASPNGLSTPTLWDTNNDGVKDTAYAGDINGNLWKFSLVGPSYTVTKLHTSDTTPVQAITTAPSVIKHPLGGHMINFVTGRMLTPADKTDTTVHAAYGIWDGAPASNSSLLAQTLTEKTFTAGTITTRVRTGTKNVPNWTAGNHKGWKTELPIGGERLVGDGALSKDSVFFFLSTNPTVSPNAAIPGENWWMQLNAITGGDNGTIQFDLNKDGYFTDVDTVTVGADKIQPVGRYFGGGIRSQLVLLSVLGNDVFQSNYDRNSISTTLVPLPPPTTNTTTTTSSGPGVSGGHFDEDIYYGSSLTASSPTSQQHNHEYDDQYDVTGVNMLNASNTGFNLSNAIPSTTTQFKVLAQNQYLSPAVSIHLKGNPAYVYNVNAGYTPIKNFITSATLDLNDIAQVPTYNRNSVQSLAINMPVDAFAQKDWWGGALGLPADVRVGLHPTQTGCVKSAAGGSDGNMYQPVIPPATVTADGNGTLGYSKTTTPATATGVRHNGALVIQIINANTPNSAIEMSVPGKPQYGWRVKSAFYSTWVLAEYTTFWHNKIMGSCYGEAGWTKLAPQDPASGTPQTKAPNSTDPKVGAFGGVATPTTPGTVTYAPISTPKDNGNGTTTTTTVTVTVTTNSNGSTTTTTKTETKTTYNTGGDGLTTGQNGQNGQGLTTGGGLDDPNCLPGMVCTAPPPPPCTPGEVCVPPCPAGSSFSSGVCTEALKVGRINWRELNR
jgi:Neisseria PilC beta-propeller domain